VLHKGLPPNTDPRHVPSIVAFVTELLRFQSPLSERLAFDFSNTCALSKQMVRQRYVILLYCLGNDRRAEEVLHGVQDRLEVSRYMLRIAYVRYGIALQTVEKHSKRLWEDILASAPQLDEFTRKPPYQPPQLPFQVGYTQCDISFPLSLLRRIQSLLEYSKDIPEAAYCSQLLSICKITNDVISQHKQGWK